MSQIEDRVEAILDDKKETKLRTRWRFRTIIIVLLLAVTAVLGSVRFFTPRQYTAKAWIQILTQKPHFVFDETMQRNYDNLVETQFALMRSPLIIEKALENPVVSQLPIVKKQLNRSDWLTKKLKLQKQGRSEMVTVSISTPDPQASETIVNSVIDAYFDYYENQSQEWNRRLVQQLTLELNRQQSAARILQDEIRSNLESAAKKGGLTGDAKSGFAPGELLLKDIYTTESKLAVLQAELKMLEELNASGQQASKAAVRHAVEQDLSVSTLAAQLDALKKTEALSKATLADANDPKLAELKEQIASTEKQLAALRDAVTQEKTDEMGQALTTKLEEEMWDKKRVVRTTEILIENLRQRYRDQIKDVGERTVQVVDVSFQQEQLKRVNSVLDLLQSRVVALQTEMNAPSQIQLRRKASVPTDPDKTGFFSFMGM